MARKVINKLVIFILIVVLFNVTIVPNVYADDTLVDSVMNAANNIQKEQEKKQQEAKKKAEETKGKGSIDEIIQGANNFVSKGEQSPGVTDKEKLDNTSDFLYNLILGIGIVVAVVVGIILGIKYMLGSVEEKAEYKESLYGYVIGCTVVFGAFGIWKLAISILNSF